MYRYTAKLSELPHNWAGHFPDLPGTAATGTTREELLENLRGVLVMHLHAMERDGDPIPVPSYNGSRAEQIEVSEDEVRSFRSDPLPSSSASV
jgi:predicted RNase H-like HicB family nuclease